MEDLNIGMPQRPDGELERAEHVAKMRSLQALHQRMVESKIRERERLDLFEAKLEQVVAELDPFDSRTEMIRRLRTLMEHRMIQYEQLDRRLDALTDLCISGAIILAEHVRLVEAPG